MKAWSFSSLTAFETCAYQFYRVKVIKNITEKPTEATDWGKRVHAALEERVRDKTPLPEWAAQWEPLASKFDRHGDSVFCELQLGLTRSFKQTGFFDDDCWYRGIVDVGIDGSHAFLGDYKTGKIKESHDQLKLFAATYMCSHEYVKSCDTKYFWLKHKKTTQLVVPREAVPVIWQEFLPRVRRLELAHENDKWPKNPSGLCNGWCPVKDCSFWKPPRNR